MGKYINPFTDAGFKRIFGQEINKDLIIDFLNTLLSGERVITDLKFLDKELIGDYGDDRSLIYDIFCKTDTGESIIVEMQNNAHRNFKERAVYYMSKGIVRQALKGKGWGYDIKAVYGVFFMNFTQKGFRGKFRTDVTLADMDDGEPFSDKIRMVFLQLPLFGKEADDCEEYFDKWIYVLKNMESLKRMPWRVRMKALERLLSVADKANMTRKEQVAYEHSLKVYRDNLVTMGYAHDEGFSKGFVKGEEKGHVKGLAEGLAMGEAKGMAEGSLQRALEIARNMKASGMDIEQISRITGLSEEEINQI